MLRHIIRIFAAGLLVAALLLVLALSRCEPVPVAAAPLAQSPGGVTLVNEGQEFVERRSNGGFIARPIFDPRPDFLAYGVRDPLDGSWLGAVYFATDSGKRVDGGWQFTIDYPSLEGQPELDPGRAYLLVLFATHQGTLDTFEAIIPIYQPSALWDRVLNAFNPSTWARSFARWVVEGVHGLLCSVVERVSAGDLENCES